MLNITQQQELLIENLNSLDSWDDKYSYIIEYGDYLPLISSEKKTDEYLVRGCQSKVWIDILKNSDDTISIFADSESDIPKGLTSMIIQIFNHQLTTDIIQADLFFLKQSGVIYYLSPLRQKGIHSVIQTIKEKVKKLMTNE